MEQQGTVWTRIAKDRESWKALFPAVKRRIVKPNKTEQKALLTPSRPLDLSQRLVYGKVKTERPVHRRGNEQTYTGDRTVETTVSQATALR